MNKYRLAKVELCDDPFKIRGKGYVRIGHCFEYPCYAIPEREFISLIKWSMRGYRSVNKKVEYYLIYSDKTEIMYFVNKDGVTITSFSCNMIDPFSSFGQFFYRFKCDLSVSFDNIKAVYFFLHDCASGKTPLALREEYDLLQCFGLPVMHDMVFDNEFDESIKPF